MGRGVAFSFRGLSPKRVRVGSALKQEGRGQVDERRRRCTGCEAARSLRSLALVLSQTGSLFHFYVAYTLPSWRLGSSVRSVNMNTELIV